MIHLNIERRYKALNLEPILEKAAEATLAHQETGINVELTIAVAADLKVQKLNRQFRGEDRATDVLSFPSEEKPSESGVRYLGDVIISVPRARAQAKKGRHSLEDEIALLAVHGILHLLGHDHADTNDKARMWGAQDEILKGLGLPISATSEAGTAHSEVPHN